MKLQEIWIENYGSFAGEHRFQLADRGLVIVLGDNQDEPRMNSNGSGKSTLFDALDWCLFGKVPRDDHADSVVHEGASGCRVVVSIYDDDGTTIQVIRERAKGPKLSLLVDGKDVTALDTSETQKLIEEILGLDRDVFHAAVLFGQTDLFRFADSTSDAERMEVLTKILQLNDIDVWLETAKTKRAEISGRWEKVEQALVAKRVGLQALEDELPTFEAQARQWEDDRALKLRQAIAQVDAHRSSVAEYQALVDRRDRVERNYQQVLTECRETVLDLSAFEGPVKEARARQARERGLAESCAAQGRGLNKQIEDMQNLGTGDCTRCGQPVSPEHIAAEVAALTAKRDALRAEYKLHDVAANKAMADARAAEAARDEQRRLHYEADKENNRIVQEARAQLDQVAQAEKYVAQMQAAIDTIRAEMAKLQEKPNPWHEREGVHRERIDTMRAEITALEVENQDDTERLKYLDFWIAGLGPKGLKSYVIDSKLQEMTDAANHWVKVLTGGTVWVRFETQTKGRTTKTLRNQLNIRVFRYNPDGSISERNYKSWSGGEKQRVSLGIDFGLSRLIAQRSRKQYDVLILDELFRHLDQAGREAVVDMLHELRREKSSVFVVDHDNEFQGAFESRVLIQKRHRQSRIVEDTVHAEEKPSPAPRVRRVPARHPVPAPAQ